jgi:hypothetical protein
MKYIVKGKQDIPSTRHVNKSPSPSVAQAIEDRATAYNQPVQRCGFSYLESWLLSSLGATLAAALAPPKQGARPGWPRPCFVYRRPLGAILALESGYFCQK